MLENKFHSKNYDKKYKLQETWLEKIEKNKEKEIVQKLVLKKNTIQKFTFKCFELGSYLIFNLPSVKPENQPDSRKQQNKLINSN